MREQLFRLPSDGGASLQSRLREMMVAAILDGHLPPGSAVPSCRQLAKQLGVARNTVVLAYQQLVDKGYLIARERSGYYVNESILNGQVAQQRRPQPASGAPVQDWSVRFKCRPSDQRQVEKPEDWCSYRYPFIYGQPDPQLFPIADWRECERRALSVQAIREWSLDRVDRDDPLLIEQLRTRVLPRRGVWAAAPEILVTLGAQQALYLIAELLMDERTCVGLEDPGYADARNIFALKSARLKGLALDGAGLVVGPQLAGCDYVYATPSHQFPTTATLPLARREQLLRRAETDDFVVIEDDYENETNFVGEPTPALKSLDRGDRVIYVGSFSKTLAPGLRLGYMVAPAALIREARVLRRLMLRHPPANNQRTVALFLALGHHDALAQRLRHAYKARWQALGEALARYLPDSARAPTFGGTSYWVRGPGTVDARILQAEAASRGILIEPGDVHFIAAQPPRNYFRLGFSSISVERIAPGIRELAALIHELAG